MKTLLALALLIGATAAGAQTNQHYTLTFTPSPQAYTGPTNVVIEIGTYYFTQSTNVALPLNQWAPFGSTPVSVIVPGNPNYVAVSSFGNFVVQNPAVFFAGSISNSAGVTPFTNLTGLLGLMSPGKFTGISSP